MRKMLSILGMLVVFQTPSALANSWSAQVGVQPCINDHAEPTDLRGVRGAVRFIPSAWNLNDIQIFLEGSYARYASDQWMSHESIHLLGLAPIIRLSFLTSTPLHPYLEGSVGAAWLSKSTFSTRDLGGHWQFQEYDWSWQPIRQRQTLLCGTTNPTLLECGLM